MHSYTAVIMDTIAQSGTHTMLRQWRDGRSELFVLEGNELVAFSSTPTKREYEADLAEFVEDFFPAGVVELNGHV